MISDEAIDTAIPAVTGDRYQKVAMTIARAMDLLTVDSSAINDKKWTERVVALVAAGKLESAGDVSNWRLSEVRLAQVVNRGS